MENKVALISGAGRGIGRAVAVELAKRGYRSLLVARTESELCQTAKLAAGSELFVADVSQSKSVNDAAAKCVERFGTINAVVHCAGVAPMLKIDETSDEEWREVMDTNLSAAFYLARAAWPIFEKRKSGVIVNISSVAARDPFPGLGIYGAAKAGINLLGLSLAREGEAHGIRVHTIAPGAVETKMLRKIITTEQVPGSKTLDPADVARVVVQCVSGDLQYTSGEVIWVHQNG